MTLITFVLLLKDIRDIIPFSVTSWWRSPVRNFKVGGVKSSYHLKGLAVDIILDNNLQVDKLKMLCSDSGLECIVYKNHCHIEPKIEPKGVLP